MRNTAHLGLALTPLVLVFALIKGDNFIGIFAFIGFVTSLLTLLQTGGVKFREPFNDRRAKKKWRPRRPASR